ncbi:aminoglycoside adenylyltransferase family protein [Legionella sp. D16C41]|uniref:aminoglycoside adenylyltransferase family protein n=1 Tax=Legionella sp. D16C41 TaxID=3402688 RepID=UPI003AF605D4
MIRALDNQATKQVMCCIDTLTKLLSTDLLGIYLYGSAIVGGLQRYSDLDLFIVIKRPTTADEKSKLVADLLNISGRYLKDSKRPIEMTVVVKSEINPWRYPPNFDFQYGEWLRTEFESGHNEPWSTRKMPDLALLITQVSIASETLLGLKPSQLLPSIPYEDVIKAIIDALDNLIVDLNHDTRNVILTLARMWYTVKTNKIIAKPDAAKWVMQYVPKQYQVVIERAKAICLGEQEEYWADIIKLIRPCTDFLILKIKEQITLLNLADSTPIIELFDNN